MFMDISTTTEPDTTLNNPPYRVYICCSSVFLIIFLFNSEIHLLH
nr:MAG TPA: hypothetical protein [Bacteriophage sp.]